MNGIKTGIQQYFEDYIYAYRLLLSSQDAVMYEVRTVKNPELVQFFDVFPINRGTLGVHKSKESHHKSALYPEPHRFLIHANHSRIYVPLAFEEPERDVETRAKNKAILKFKEINV